MKKLLVVLLALTLVALPLWAACAPEEVAPPPPEEEAAPPPPPPPPPEPVKWVLSTPSGSETYGGKGITWVVDRIKEKSDGQLLIEPYYAGALGYKSPEYLAVLKDGLVDMAELSAPSAIGTEPLCGACVLSFGFYSYEEYLEFAHTVLEPKLSQTMEDKWNTKIIGTFMFPRTALFADRPINSVDDIKGMKIRVIGGIDPKVYAALGAEPTYIPWEDLYTALQRGLIQAMPNSFSVAYDVKVWEVCDHATIMGYVIGNSFLVVNKQSFDALPKDLQDIVLEAGTEFSDYMLGEVSAVDEPCIAAFVEQGMVVTKMPEAVLNEFKAKAKIVWHEWAEETGPEAVEILKAGGLW